MEVYGDAPVDPIVARACINVCESSSLCFVLILCDVIFARSPVSVTLARVKFCDVVLKSEMTNWKRFGEDERATKIRG